MSRPIIKRATPDDRYVGERIREARNLIGMSQGELGTLLGISYQQVQKYENGSNRVSIGRLSNLERALRKPVQFFIPRAGDIRTSDNPVVSKLLSTKDFQVHMQNYSRLRTVKSRRVVNDLTAYLADQEEQS